MGVRAGGGGLLGPVWHALSRMRLLLISSRRGGGGEGTHVWHALSMSMVRQLLLIYQLPREVKHCFYISALFDAG